MLPYSEACERNKQPILSRLKIHLAETQHVLEIASGTGQHAVYFAAHLMHLRWQPSELSANLAGIEARLKAEKPENVMAPLELDVAKGVWPVESTNAVFSANSLHIMSWAHVVHFFSGVGRVLEPDGVLSVYGPFKYHGEYTSESNAAFDVWLKQRDPLSGIRDAVELERLAAEQRLEFVADHELPANNRLLVWKRKC